MLTHESDLNLHFPLECTILFYKQVKTTENIIKDHSHNTRFKSETANSHRLVLHQPHQLIEISDLNQGGSEVTLCRWSQICH